MFDGQYLIQQVIEKNVLNVDRQVVHKLVLMMIGDFDEQHVQNH